MSNWNDWSTVSEAIGEKVLVKFKMSGGETHIEDADIDNWGDGPEPILFDGEQFNISVIPIAWMRIPE